MAASDRIALLSALAGAGQGFVQGRKNSLAEQIQLEKLKQAQLAQKNKQEQLKQAAALQKLRLDIARRKLSTTPTADQRSEATETASFEQVLTDVLEGKVPALSPKIIKDPGLLQLANVGIEEAGRERERRRVIGEERKISLAERLQAVKDKQTTTDEARELGIKAGTKLKVQKFEQAKSLFPTKLASAKKDFELAKLREFNIKADASAKLQESAQKIGLFGAKARNLKARTDKIIAGVTRANKEWKAADGQKRLRLSLNFASKFKENGKAITLDRSTQIVSEFLETGKIPEGIEFSRAGSVKPKEVAALQAKFLDNFEKQDGTPLNAQEAFQLAQSILSGEPFPAGIKQRQIPGREIRVITKELVDAIAGKKALLLQLGRITEDFDTSFIGRGDALWAWARDSILSASVDKGSKENIFQTEVKKFFNTAANEFGGKNLTKNELEQIRASELVITDSESKFASKIDNTLLVLVEGIETNIKELIAKRFSTAEQRQDELSLISGIRASLRPPSGEATTPEGRARAFRFLNELLKGSPKKKSKGNPLLRRSKASRQNTANLLGAR